MHFAYSPSAPAPPETAFERQAIGKIAACVWAAIAFFGALATVKPLRFPEMDVSSMRLVVFSATVIAGVTLVVPWARMPKAFLNLLLVLMAGYITALVHASGAVNSPLMTLVTFGIALAVCFLPVRTSVAQVVIIAVLLAAGLILLDKEDAGVQALRTSLLLSLLLVLCGLVLILRAVIAEREASVGRRLFENGFLDARGFDRTLERELSRAMRHKRPLAIALVEISGELEAAPERHGGNDRLVRAVGQAMIERLRDEDSAGHLGGMRFGLLVPETDAAGAASVAGTISEQVRRELESLGHERSSFEVSAGWAGYPHHAESHVELVAVAQHNLEAASVRNELRPAPSQADPSPSARPVAE